MIPDERLIPRRPRGRLEFITTLMKAHFSRPSFALLPAFLAALLGLLLGEAGRAAQPQVVRGHVPAASARLAAIGGLDAAQQLKLAIGLPPRDPQGLKQLLKELYDPASPNFRKYLTPAQFTERFGPSQADYEAVSAFAKAHHLTVTATHSNRVILDVEGTAADIEAAFHLRLRTYQHPTEARQFYAPDAEPSLDLATPILHISGLDNYALPRPNLVKKPVGLAAPAAANSNSNSGSGPSGTLGGGDFRAAYVPGTALTGAGQSIALLEYDGFYPSDIAAYESQFGLPNIPVVVVPIDGGVRTPGSDNVEVCLDIEVAMAMAPGISTIYVYEEPNSISSSWDDMLSRMADDNLAQQLSCSWGGGGPDATAEVIFQQMAAQGQSFYTASGDSDAYTSEIPFPADSPNITVVGGTTLTTSGANGSYVSETAWNWGDGVGSSGGVSTYYSIPAWQQGISMVTNLGSTTMRNIPDVALTADNVYVTSDNGYSGAVGGTSCAAPLWAAFTALVNEEAAANSLPPVGFVNPAIYALGGNFNDVVTGNNFSSSSPGKFPAVPGYDLCTGWGTPGNVLIDALLGAAPLNLVYSTNPATYVAGISIVPNKPANFGGLITSYAVAPPLPAGLSLNPTTGAITGVPLAATAAADYTVTGSNDNGGVSATVNITVVPLTAPANLAYAVNPAVYTLASATTPNTLSNQGGPATQFSIAPALPSGLSFDSASGTISGTPTSRSSATNYTVTASNSAGSATVKLSITVKVGSSSPGRLFVSGGNDLGFVGEYNSVTGDEINSSVITGLSYPSGLALSANNLFEVDYGGGVVSQFSAETGAPINGGFVSGLESPYGIAISGASLVVTSIDSGVVGVYNSLTGAAINSDLIAGLSEPISVAISGDTLYVADYYGSVGKYNASTGAAINANFIAGLPSPNFLLLSGNNLFISSSDGSGVVGKYNATTGAVINANFITGLSDPQSLAISGNTLYVVNYSSGVIGEYKASTGAVINANFITGLDSPVGIAVRAPITSAPSGLTYALNPAVYALGVPIAPNTPSNAGGLTTVYSISSPLPVGLAFDPASGVISGTPVAPSAAANYTITGANALGSTTATVNITVREEPPAALTYSTNPADYLLASPIAANVPSSSGSPVLSYAISPALPTGLVFNATSGVISGTPTSASPGTTYTVTATNHAGSTTASVVITVHTGASAGQLFVSNQQGDFVGEYNPQTGAAINDSFITGVSYPSGLALTGNHLFVASQFDSIVSEYNAATGAAISASFISGLGTPNGLALSSNLLFVANYSGNSVGKYDAATGSAINAAFITGLDGPANLAVSGNTLFVSNTSSGTVGAYNAATGATINASFITGLGTPQGLALFGNVLFVADYDGGVVDEYNATTGALIKAGFISGLDGPWEVAIAGNTLFVSAWDGGTIGAYDVSTGAALNANLITGLNGPEGLAIVSITAAPSSLAYSVNPALYPLGRPISPNMPTTTGGEPSAYSISPALPAGLTLDGATGIISGTPTAASPAANYVVTAANSLGSITATLNLAVIDLPPSSLAYSANPAVYALGNRIAPNTPSSTGSPVLTYSISPALPSGLVFSTSTGVISGKPVAETAAATYTVTATNNAGSATVGVNIAVVDVAPSSLTYTTNPALYVYGTPISNNVPSSVGSPVVSYSVSPALPAGLVLNTATGVISGTPTAITASATYTITATNNGGSATVGLNITVLASSPKLLVGSYAGVGEYNSSTGAAINSDFVTGVYYVDGLAILGNNLFISNSDGGAVGEYNLSTGELINSRFISGLGHPAGLAVSGNTLFVADEGSGVVGAYNASTGAVINARLITGFTSPVGLALSRNTLFVSDIYTGVVGAYNAATGAAIDAAFISGLAGPAGLAVSGKTLFVALYYDSSVAAYDTTTGGVLNPTLVTGVTWAFGLAVSGNVLFVGSEYGSSVGAYNASTGAVVNANLITGVDYPDAIAILPPIGPPAGLTYAVNPAAYTLGRLIPTNAPTSTGGVITSYSVSPALPSGLALDPVAGTIDGTPTVAAATADYTVTGSNSYGSVAATVTIAVNDVAPSALAYFENPAVYSVGTPIPDNVPSSIGSLPLSYSISPALPAGLALDSATGIISGTPTAVTAGATYTVTATNHLGSTSVGLTIAVTPAIPKLFVGFETGVGEYNASTGAAINASFVTGLSYVPGLAISGNTLFVTNPGSGSVAECNLSTGALINRYFISGLNYPTGLAVSGNTLFVADETNGTVGTYNASTGIAINASFITGLYYPVSLALSGNTLFVSKLYEGTVGAYNATTGIAINASFISGLSEPVGLAVSGNTLFVSSYESASVGAYNISTGAALNSSLVTGLSDPFGLAVSGNVLYVANEYLGAVGAYNASTGAVINASLITGLWYPASVAIVPAAGPPTDLTYAVNPAAYTLGRSIATNTPNSTGGAITSYSVSPALPSGLTLDPVAGTIDGTPAAAAATADYTVTGSNALGSVTATVTITVNDVAPSALAYSLNPAIYSLGTTIPDNIPSSAGSPPLSYSVSPTLPAGLALNPTTGVISGTPTAVVASATYTVTATNDAGSTTVGLNITVVAAIPKLLVGFEPGVGEYNASTGAAINASFVTGVGTVPGLAISGNTLFVTNPGLGNVAECDLSTGALINGHFISGLGDPTSLAISGNMLFVADVTNGTVGVYNASTGVAINARLITGLYYTMNLALSGNTLFVSKYSEGTVGAYDATTGVAINASLISGLSAPLGLAVSGNTLFVASYQSSSVGVVGAYNALTGAALNPTLVVGLSNPFGLAVSRNVLYVANAYPGSVGAYNASTGAVINSSLITGLEYPGCIAIVPAVGPPASLTYALNPAAYTLGRPIPTNTPNSTGGAITSYSVSPALPPGLTLDPVAGTIDGTPTAAAATAGYTVTGSNALGSVTATVTITVNDVAPSALAYSLNPAIYSLGTTIPDNVPSSAGSPPLSYSISPALPAGLALNPTTGVISGTPAAIIAGAIYTVTAMNDVGSTTVGLNIAVTAVPPSLFVGLSSGVGKYNASTGAAINANLITGLNYADGVAISGNNLFVTNAQTNVVAEYNLSTGALINANFIAGLNYPWGLAITGNTLFVSNALGNTIGAYNASTGAVINARLITGLSYPEGLAISGNTLYVANESGNWVGAFNAATGAAINAGFVTGLSGPTGLAISGNTLFVANSGSAKVGAYNATTGAVINASFVAGLNYPQGLAVAGNVLYVANEGASSVGEYNASTGATINASFITGLNGPWSLAVPPAAAPPAGLTYAVNPAAYTLGQPISANTPSNTGGLITSYSVSPALPQGLALDPATGIISGTPSALATAGNYTVTAANDSGSTTVVLSIAVNDIPPASLKYTVNSAVYTKGVAISANTPSSSGGAVVSYSVFPGLPAGLALNTSTGVISGTPITLAPPASYTVTATNSGGTATATLNITVNDVPPSNLVYATNPAIYTKGSAIVANSPSSSGGPVLSYSVAPALPAGLALNTTSGIITGTPTAPASAAAYTVRATNSGGITSAVLILTINDVPPSNLVYTTNPAVYSKGASIGANSPSSNGGPVLSYSVSPALPAGLALNTTSGVITGTPTALSLAANYTVTATNSGGSTSAILTFTVNDIPPSNLVYSTNTAVYTKGSAIVANNPSSNGGPVLSYAVSPVLPAGLVLNTSSGVITGTPTALATAAAYTVTATNSGGSTNAVLTLTVNDVPPSNLVYTTNPAVYTKGASIGVNSPSSNGGLVLSYSVSPALPAGLALNTSSGVITGTPTTLAPAAAYTVMATNSGGSTSAILTLTVNDAPPFNLVYTTNPAAYTKGAPIGANSPSSNGGPVLSYSVSPALPAGLALNTSSGVITGTPTTLAPVAAFTVTATNSGGSTNAILTLTVNDVPPSNLVYTTNLAVYTKGSAIMANSPSIKGGSVLSYSVSPALPAGLVLNTTSGVITGTPTALAAVAAYTVTATNSGGSTSAVLTLTVNDVPPTNFVYSTNPAIYTKGTAIVANNPSADGGAVVSYIVSPSLPAGLALNSSTGIITGTPAALAPAADYTIAALNSGGSTVVTLNITVNDAPPSALVYSVNPAVYTKGMPIAANNPSGNGGAVVSYSISPSLPAGLSLNTSTGVITGAPVTLASAAVYTVRATNTGGSTTVALNLTVNDAPPTELVYATNPASYRIGAVIVSNRPTHNGGAVVSYSVSPALPVGLDLDSATGALSGTPTAITPSATYTVTATNTGGFTTAALNLTILDALPVAQAQSLQATTHLPVDITLGATEVIPEPTTYTIATPPLHGALTGSAPNLQYISDQTFAGLDSFTFVATDNGGASTPATITIAVAPAVSRNGYYAGKYVGLIRGADAAHSGTITIVLPGTGSFTASIKYGGVTHPLKGSFVNAKNRFTGSVGRGASALAIELDFGIPVGPDVITGEIGGSAVEASNAVYSASAPPAEAGKYTVNIPPDPTQTDGSVAPQGYGVGSLVVGKTGTIRCAGTLADGTGFSQGTLLTRNGVWHLYAPLYAKKGPLAGMLEGVIQFEVVPETSDLDGGVVWIRPPSVALPTRKSALYPAGFNLTTNLLGAAYNPKSAMVLTPNSLNNTFTAQGGSLAGGSLSEATMVVKLASGLKLTGANSLSLKVSTSTGLISGTFKDGAARSASKVNAVIFQTRSTPSIIGSFRDVPITGANESGAVTLTSP